MTESDHTPPEVSATQELVRRAREGDDDAFAQLAARYRPRLCRWAAGRVPGDLRGLLGTEDLVQDALLATLGKVRNLRQSGAFQGYLRRAVLNGLRDEIRRRRTVALDARPTPIDPLPSPAEQAAGRELLERYEQALGELPERERSAVVARLEWGFSYRELAAELDYPSPDAARMAVGRALAQISKAIQRARRTA